MTTTQVPVIASRKRYMTVRECAALQRLQGLRSLPAHKSRAFKALGNAVNAEMVRRIAHELLKATPTRDLSRARKDPHALRRPS
jgi:DNA (cytosine-5)-methyltransferase 1